VQTTREQILRLVRASRDVTVAQLAEALGLSQQAVRRHLDGLRADGLIDARLVRHGVGRPSLVFSITERGEEAFSRGYVHLLTRVFRGLEQVKQQSPGEAGGVVDSLFSAIAAQVAAEHQSEVRGQTLDERVAEASRALQSEGIVDGWRKIDGVLQMLNSQCPYLRLAEMTDAPCRSDRQSIELLVGAPVEQTSRIAAGAPVCEYIIYPPAAAPPSGAENANYESIVQVKPDEQT
jgi:DeoR family suf operon transcriptional repressor